MELEHKNFLKEKSNVISSNVSLDKIKPLLKKYKIFNKYMWLDIKSVSDVFELLPSRGPEAYQNIICILREANYYMEANMLEKGSTVHLNFPKELIYKMTSKPLGYCLLINNVDFVEPFEERKGSYKDAVSLQKFFKSIGYEVYIETNMTTDKMNKRIQQFSMFNFKNVDSSIVIILSHGGQDENQDIIYGTDGGALLKRDIINNFNNLACQQMQGKPKVFIFNACRGNNKDYGAPKLFPSESPDSLGGLLGVMPTISDILVVHSSLPDKISMRDHDDGSWFCQDFLSVLREHYLKYDLEDIIKMANSKLMTRVSKEYCVTQAAHSENYGFKKFFLCGSPLSRA